jgi:hypothetical protein
MPLFFLYPYNHLIHCCIMSNQNKIENISSNKRIYV